MKIRLSWPFMLKSTHEAVRRENFFLRGALRDANAELLKHRKLIAGLNSGDPRLTDAVMRAFTGK